MKCKGCIRRREQLRIAKELVLSVIPGYNTAKLRCLSEAKRLISQGGGDPTELSKRIAEEDSGAWEIGLDMGIQNQIDRGAEVLEPHNEGHGTITPEMAREAVASLRKDEE